MLALLKPKLEFAGANGGGRMLREQFKQLLVADFDGLPDEGALNFGDGDLVGLYPSKQSFDRVTGDGVALGGHRLATRGLG